MKELNNLIKRQTITITIKLTSSTTPFRLSNLLGNPSSKKGARR
ncbi:MAG: hypothetical protein R3Y68_09895 [Rikenellaceae bacterium]